MRRGLVKGALALPLLALALSGCDGLTGRADDEANASQAAASGPPPLPPYQMRAEVGAGDRMSPAASGDALFSHRCGACHLAAGMGTNLITAQQVAAGRPPEMGLLANRDDLTADYVKAVARSGKGAMPPQTRVDVTDAELDKIAAYLGRGK